MPSLIWVGYGARLGNPGVEPPWDRLSALYGWAGEGGGLVTWLVTLWGAFLVPKEFFTKEERCSLSDVGAGGGIPG